MSASDPPRYLSTHGPLDGPIRDRDARFTIGVHVEARQGPVGMARPVGWVPDPKDGPPIATFRLQVGKGPMLPGLWTCDRQVFVRLDPARAAESSWGHWPKDEGG